MAFGWTVTDHSFVGCKKGDRECVYPDASGNSKGGPRHKSSEQRSAGQSSNSPEAEDQEDLRLTTIKDEDEETAEQNLKPPSPPGPVKKESHQSLNRPDEIRQQSESSSSMGLSPPSTEESPSFSRTQTPASSIPTMPSDSTIRSNSRASPSSRWSHLKRDLRDLLQYHQDHITFFHYFFKLDSADFIHTEFIDLALSYEPLLYAIVGFSAYHRTLKNPDGKLSAFLGYYSRSLSSLRKDLETGHKNSEATILTICTLATFEVIFLTPTLTAWLIGI